MVVNCYNNENTNSNTNKNTNNLLVLVNPSLCIPRVDFTITKDQIYNVFEKLDLGRINRVDVINKKSPKGDNYKCVFIHFYYWHETENALKIKNRIMDKNDVKIVFDFPWYWKVCINKWKNDNY